jgi:hypothetical protein
MHVTQNNKGHTPHLHIGKDLILNISENPIQEKKQQDRYYKLVILQIVMLAITFVLLVINTFSTNYSCAQLYDQIESLKVEPRQSESHNLVQKTAMTKKTVTY